MEKHYGQIVEHLVRKNGYSITDLATELAVNRRSIYNYFENKFLKTDVIYKIGCVIRHDFSREFPELFTPEDFIPTNKSNRVTRRTNFEASDAMDNQWKDKYLDLLENYNQALLKKLSQSTANSLKENAAN